MVRPRVTRTVELLMSTKTAVKHEMLRIVVAIHSAHRTANRSPSSGGRAVQKGTQATSSPHKVGKSWRIRRFERRWATRGKPKEPHTTCRGPELARTRPTRLVV